MRIRMVHRNYTTLAHDGSSCGHPTRYDTPNFTVFCSFSEGSAVTNRNITSLYALDINRNQYGALYVLNVESQIKQNTPHNHNIHQTVIIYHSFRSLTHTRPLLSGHSYRSLTHTRSLLSGHSFRSLTHTRSLLSVIHSAV